MNKDIIHMKCDRILIEKQSELSSLLNHRIQNVYQKHKDSLGKEIDYTLLTDFTSDLLTAYNSVISEVMVRLIQEVLSEEEDLT